MLLSGPPSARIFFEPGVEDNTVVHTAAPELDDRYVQLGKERDADTEVFARLILGEAAAHR